jgi:pyridoxine kinase
MGRSAIRPRCRGCRSSGSNVLGLPTVLLSNHPGHGSPVRQAVAAETMKAMLERVADHGWLDGLAGVMTGYFVDAAQVEVAAEAIARLKAANPDLLYVCDPVLGDDDPGLYVPEEVARAIGSRLVPLADVITPNRFELAWLAGRRRDRAGLGGAAGAQPCPCRASPRRFRWR